MEGELMVDGNEQDEDSSTLENCLKQLATIEHG